MKSIWFGLSILSLASMANSDCCHGTQIWFSIEDDVQCNDVPGGEEKMKIPIDVMGIFENLDRRRPACRIEVCDDGKLHDGTYCGKGPCNWWGCNCDGGCIAGEDALTNFKKIYANQIKKASAHSLTFV